VTDVRSRLEEAVNDTQASTRELHAGLMRQLKQIDKKESRLIDLAADDAMPRAKIRAKLNDLKLEKARIEAGLVSTGEELAIGAQVLRDALYLVEDPQRLYEDMPDAVRRHLNQTFYTCFYIDDLEVTDDVKAPLFAELHEAGGQYTELRKRTSTLPIPVNALSTETDTSPRQAEALVATGTGLLRLTSVFPVNVSSKAVLVGLTGFEPATT